MLEWLGFKWPPVLKVWKQLCNNDSKVSQNTYRQKAFAVLLLKHAPRVQLPNSDAEKNKHENFNFVILLLS